MRTLQRTLEDYDLGHLRIIAELWGFDPPSASSRQAADSLAKQMLDSSNAQEIVQSLPADVRKTLTYIQSHGGQAPLSDLIRIYGPLREMGAARRDREKPWRSPESPLESLWYRGLIARAFADSETGPLEFAIIPSDLAHILPQPPRRIHEPLGHPAEAPTIRIATSSAAVDDATTILAALRKYPEKGNSLTQQRRDDLASFLQQPDALEFMVHILCEASILNVRPLSPNPEKTRLFLESSRAEALKTLILTWLHSNTWNDLQTIDYLENSGSGWPNEPVASRRAAIQLFQEIPHGSWWGMNGFIEDVHVRQPAFQRPAGEFTSWYFKDNRTDSILHGLEDWDAVDGALLRYLLMGPLHWLGVVDLGKQSGHETSTFFRLTPAITLLFDPETTLTIKESLASAYLWADGRLRVPRRAVRSLRYQIARFTRWEPIDEENYLYRITPDTLQAAQEQSLELTHILSILESALDKPIPVTLLEALQRWSERGSEARIERSMILQVHDSDTLELLQNNRSTARYLQELLGPSNILIREQDWPQLCAAAARLGLLIEPPKDE
jgi:hypothetical protein